MIVWVRYPVCEIDNECDTTNELRPKLIQLAKHVDQCILRGIDLPRWVPIRIIIKDVLSTLQPNKPYIWIKVDK